MLRASTLMKALLSHFYEGQCHKCNEVGGGGSGDRMGTHDHHHFKGKSKENNSNNKKNRIKRMDLCLCNIIIGIFKQASRSIPQRLSVKC